MMTITSPNGITNTEIQAFFQLEDIQPTPWQLELLRAFDYYAIEHRNKQVKA